MNQLALQEAMSVLPSWRVCERLRRAYYRRALAGCGPNFEVSQHAVLKFPDNLRVGANVFINRGVFITARAPISIGDNTIIGPYTIINSGDHGYMDVDLPIRRQGHVSRPITIGSDVWIGAHAVITKGAVLGDGCVVAANAVVSRDVPPYTVVGGVPARTIKLRGAGPKPTADEPFPAAAQ
ncbi:MAG: hypothetical protein QOG59_3072 [Solirubrobacteraceae bacterium]|jgi:acetyltransferase-like isoleucine patch superfamily enzyme|nr:hypothetical protein [Solirubrobacteraceae bacterium]